MRRLTHCALAALAACCAVGASPAQAQLAEHQVLVVYNSASAEAVTLLADYLAARPGIPPENVLDLNSAALLTANVSYANYISLIRTPIRSYLSAPGAPQPEDIVAFALLRPFPHRIQDSDNANVGDNPSGTVTEFNSGDCTNASVDAELVLLWQDLEIGEQGGAMDSRSDNMIDNPYHQSSSSILAFSRTSITTQKLFSNLQGVAWGLVGAGGQRLRQGDLYLVCRIDGTTLADAQALITRSQNIVVPKPAVKIILDEYDPAIRAPLDDNPLFSSGDPFVAGQDYEEARNILSAQGWNVRYDATFDFITADEETAPIIAYASYGENHSLSAAGENPPGNGTYIDGFNLAPGAIFNTTESYNGRALNGLGTLFNQEQVADFVTAGGTFAIGHVWEPFTVTLPDNEFLFVNMLINRRSWAEAAYSSLPALSWHHVVVGDPLARYERPGDCEGDDDVDLADGVKLQWCASQAVLPTVCRGADMDGNGAVNLADYDLWEPLMSGPR